MKLWGSLLLVCVSVSAQPDPDSLLTVLSKLKSAEPRCETLNDISDFYYQVDPAKGVAFANKALNLAVKLKFQAGIGRSHFNLGKHNMVLGKYDSALIELDKSRAIYASLSDNCALGKVMMFRGSVYGNLSKYPDALDALFTGLGHFENCGDPESNKPNTAFTYQNIANIYNATENYEKALANYDKAIEILREIPGEEISVAMNIASKGIIYEKQKRYDEALSVYLDAMKKLKKEKDSEVPMAFVNSWLGETYLSKGEFEKSLQSSEAALDVISKIGDRDLMASTIQHIGYALFRKGKNQMDKALVDQGAVKLQEALSIHKTLKNHEGLIADYKYLGDYFRFKKQFDKAIDAFELASVYKDSVFNFKNKQSLQNLEDKRSIELRDKKLELNKVTIAARERQNLFSILGIAALLAIGSLLYWQSYNRKKTNRKLNILNSELDVANQTKARLFSIIGHDLRTPVSHIYQFLELQKNEPELFSEDDKKRHNERITSAAGNLLETMEDLLTWSKSQMQEFQVNDQRFNLAETIVGILSLFQNQIDKKRIVLLSGIDPELSIRTDRNMFSIIIRNLLQNAINAAPEASEISIGIKKSAELNFLELSNHGKEMPADARGTLENGTGFNSGQNGLGLSLVHQLIQRLGMSVLVQRKDGLNVISLELPGI